MPLQATSGAVTYDAYGGGVTAANYIEDVFQTWLHSGNGSTQTITNGIDLSTKGGLVWVKKRSAAESHFLVNSASPGFRLETDGTGGQGSQSVLSLTSSGFSLLLGNAAVNGSGSTYASWTFRKQPKFFDVVTYTGNGSTQAISHSLGSVPGCIIIKSTSSGSNWVVYHRSLGEDFFLKLNLTDSSQYSTTVFDITAPTSTNFTVGSNSLVNTNGATYVAYLFAHNAGGFGRTGTDNVISCGSFTTNSTGNATVNLGYEPQWLMVKCTSSSENWYLVDNMRGWPADTSFGKAAVLYPNLSNAEANFDALAPTSTGFTAILTNNQTFIYIAIRRGPMKTPTTGTSVFGNNARSGTGANATVTGGQTDDLAIIKNRGAAQNPIWATRLIDTRYIQSNGTAAEVAAGTNILQSNPWDLMDGVKVGTTSALTNASSNTFINYLFRRAPGFFDVVCYTGTGSSATSYSHNLGVAPELIINKVRSASGSNWIATFNFTSTNYVLAALNLTIAGDTFLYTDGASIEARPTSTAMRFTGGVPAVNDSGQTYVAYLFASCPGVSKVGSYTGTGALQTIDCGFTGGARWVMIKRTDDVGDWLVYDSARGITSGNDPYFRMNSSAAEITGTNYVDTTSVGFQVTAAAPAGLNANGGTYIFLAVA